MTEQEIALMRSRIAELEECDADFAQKSNLLLDEILLTHDQEDLIGAYPTSDQAALWQQNLKQLARGK